MFLIARLVKLRNGLILMEQCSCSCRKGSNQTAVAHCIYVLLKKCTVQEFFIYRHSKVDLPSVQSINNFLLGSENQQLITSTEMYLPSFKCCSVLLFVWFVTITIKRFKPELNIKSRCSKTFDWSAEMLNCDLDNVRYVCVRFLKSIRHPVFYVTLCESLDFVRGEGRPQ